MQTIAGTANNRISRLGGRYMLGGDDWSARRVLRNIVRSSGVAINSATAILEMPARSVDGRNPAIVDAARQPRSCTKSALVDLLPLSQSSAMRKEPVMDPVRERRSDEALLAAAKSDPDAFGAFYERHESAMLVFFMRRTFQADVSADLTAEVFAAALESLHRFRPHRGPAVAWIYGIANNKLLASWRRGRVEDRARRRLGMEPLLLDDEELERVERLVDADALSEALNELLSALPVEQHDAVRRRVLEEHSYEEIARDLACSEALVRQRVSRGLRTVRTGLIESI